MIAKQLLPALAAIGSVAAKSATTCTVSTTTINSQADATGLASCSAVKGSVLIAPGAGPQIDISGPSTISGDVILLNNGIITSLTSSNLGTIGGEFHLQNVTLLSTLSFMGLGRVGSIVWQSLPALGQLTFGTPGVTEANNVTISDTFLSSLDGIDLTHVSSMDINNNRRLTDFTTQLGNVSSLLNIAANGLQLKVSMPNLIWITEMSIANVTSFSVPSLAVVNGSARFDFNYFSSFNAPNLTTAKTEDISFVGNPNLANITMPELTSIGGGLLIANNTALSKVNGFPALKTVGGAVKLRGNFTDIEFPALNDVKGAFDISSTADISSSCNTFQKLAPSSQGGGGQIQGTYSCTSNNANANSDTGTGTSGSGSGGSSSGSNNTAAGLTINHALLGLAAVGGFAQALW
ncbi:GPI-anchored cell wall organization protein ecm33 [Diplogelasinospora grovesii]|uniref:GPI-anchored cell wall organization protein ecm33 n=1 Tax=Diplogelasinospora grovesii TaxID=303347 RepID=A0AAN6NB91_9PEZI|nr:GPI-anchored cell wall organization protein ecm33 [Diplogelasinospora grovesii]